MEALFQIGKEIGSLEARVKALETGDCGCRSKSRPLKESELSGEQKAVLSKLRSSHSAVVAGFNQVLQKLKLADKLRVESFTLFDGSVLQGDPDECCACCTDGRYCCDFKGCKCC